MNGSGRKDCAVRARYKHPSRLRCPASTLTAACNEKPAWAIDVNDLADAPAHACGLASLGSILGLLAVFGIAARNGLTLVGHYRRLEKEEGQGLSAELVMRGTRDRVVPIVMTAVATGLAFLPFMLFGEIAGYEILNPMAIVVLGGLVSATLVTLFVVPSLYLGLGVSSDRLDIVSEEEEAA